MNELFVIPQSPNSLLAKVADGIISIVRTIDIPYNSISKITNNNLIVSLCLELEELRICDISGQLITKKTHSPFKALAVKQNTAYLGGEYDNNDWREQGEMFSIIDLDMAEIELKNIDLPVKVIEGKRIDDILVLDNKLILVDDVVFPKYLFEYDISIPNNPVHIRTKDLPSNRPNETIIKGDINKDWLVLFSETSHMGGWSQHISVSGKTYGHLSLYYTWEQKKLGVINPFFYVDICLAANWLLILTNDGLGYLDLKKSISRYNFKKITTKCLSFEKLIKTSAMDVIGVNENNYELINVEEKFQSDWRSMRL